MEGNLNFNLSYKDISIVNSIIKDFIDDRKRFYTNIFNDEKFSDIDIKQYLNYFTNLALDDIEKDSNKNDENEGINKDKHPYIFRLLHFFERNYEFFIQPEVEEIIFKIRNILMGNDFVDFNIDDFEEIEFEQIQSLEALWQEFLNIFSKYPLLNLDKMNYEKVCNCQVYYQNSIQPFMLQIFKKFLTKINNFFPNILLRFDTFVLIDPSFIEIRAGEGTVAYFTDSCAFFPESCKEGEQNFIYQVFFHEFGHYLFSLISEELVYYWYDNYEEWLANGTKLSRDEGYNEVEELFADAFSCIFADSDDFIHKPSDIIIDTVKFIINSDFV